MQMRVFLKKSTSVLGAIPLIKFDYFSLFKSTFLVNDDVFKINIGNFECTLFRENMYKYIAKDFFINADQEDVNHFISNTKQLRIIFLHLLYLYIFKISIRKSLLTRVLVFQKTH